MIHQVIKRLTNNPQYTRRCYSFVLQPKPDIKKNRRHSDSEGFFWASSYEDVNIPELSIGEYIFRNMRIWQDKTAVECFETNRKYTYSQLRDSSVALSIRLQKQFDLNADDVVGLMMPNIPEYPIAFLGITEAGIKASTINPNYTPNEIARQISITGLKLMITIPSAYNNILKAFEISKISGKIIVIKTRNDEQIPSGGIDFYELIKTEGIDLSNFSTKNINTNDVCALPFSSGTTGLPKGVELVHRNFITELALYNNKLPFESLSRPSTKDYQETSLGILPFFHIAGLANLLLPQLSIGCRVVTYQNFTSDNFLSGLIKYKPSFAITVPPIFLILANNPKTTNEHLASIRHIGCGASTLGELDARRVLEKNPALKFIQAYGLSESCGAAMLSQTAMYSISSIGWPGATTEAKICKIDDPNAIGVDSNEIGEILVRGSNIMKGYYKNDEATRKTITSNGWLRTGDLGYYDDDGFFYIKDRIKELIKVNAFQVAPAELEELLRDHPAVAESAVIGIPNERSGEIPKAFVVCKQGLSVSENELKAFVDKQVVDYKRLQGGIVFVDKIPKTASGKILRKELKLM